MKSEAALAVMAVLMFFLGACGDGDVSPVIVDLIADPFSTVVEPVLTVLQPEEAAVDGGADGGR